MITASTYSEITIHRTSDGIGDLEVNKCLKKNVTPNNLYLFTISQLLQYTYSYLGFLVAVPVYYDGSQSMLHVATQPAHDTEGKVSGRLLPTQCMLLDFQS